MASEEKKSSVKQKLEGISKKKAEVNAAVNKQHANMRAQANANKAAVGAVFAGVRKLQSDIRQQERVNAAAVAQIDAGTRQVVAGIKETTRVVQAAVNKLHSNIRSQASENSAYIKDFYFG